MKKQVILPALIIAFFAAAAFANTDSAKTNILLASTPTPAPTKNCEETDFLIKWPSPEPTAAALMNECIDYYCGITHPVDYIKSGDFCMQAVSAKAHTEMCDCWYFGLGYQKNYEKALACFRNEDPFITTFMLVKGLGTKPDKAAAIKYIKGQIASGRYTDNCRLNDLLSWVQSDGPLNELGPDKHKEIWDNAMTTADMVDAAGRDAFYIRTLNSAVEYHIKQKLGDKSDNEKRYYNAWKDYAEKEADAYVYSLETGSMGRFIYVQRLQELDELRTDELTLFFNLKPGQAGLEKELKAKDDKLNEVYIKLRLELVEKDKKVMESDKEEGAKKPFETGLKEAERAWLVYCDAANNMYMTLYGGSPDKKQIEQELRKVLTEKRIKALESFEKDINNPNGV